MRRADRPSSVVAAIAGWRDESPSRASTISDVGVVNIVLRNVR
jgi:hypothetical protein